VFVTPAPTLRGFRHDGAASFIGTPAANEPDVHSLLALAALALTGPGPASAEGMPLPARLALIVAAERVPLPTAAKGIELLLEPLAGTIELRNTPHPTLLAQRMAASAGQICPQVEPTAAGVLVRCRTRRLDARILVDRDKTFLEVQQLHGMPWRHERDRLAMFYDPPAVGFGGPCPGTTLAGRAECALKDGHGEEAAALFKQALASA